MSGNKGRFIEKVFKFYVIKQIKQIQACSVQNIIKHLASSESTQEVGKNASILAPRFLEEDSSLVVIFTTTGKAAAGWHGSTREHGS